MRKEVCKNGHQLTDETRRYKITKEGKTKSNGCKLCSQLRSKKWNEDNKEHSALQSKLRYLKHRDKILQQTKERKCERVYGITLEQRNAILIKQHGQCANRKCGRILSKGHLDHDHTSGNVRGILCSQCNMALGLMQDDCNKLKGLIAYLIHHTKGHL